MAQYIWGMCDWCCTWLKINKTSTIYERKAGENENQQFMKEQHESIPQTQEQQYSSKKDLAIISKKVEEQNKIEVQGQNIPIEHQMHDLLKEEFNINQYIRQDHPYKTILGEKIQTLSNLFPEELETDSKTPQTPYNLKIEIRGSEDEKTSIFIYKFTFPTNYEFYEQMQNNFKLQKGFDSNIDHYECREMIDEQTKIIYLAYKKVLIVSPRDFIYVRYTFKQGQNVYWSVATSLPNQEIYQGTVRGSIMLTATKVEQIEGSINISVYSQVDMKMPIKQSAARVRGIAEIKKYLDKCYEYVVKEKNNIL